MVQPSSKLRSVGWRSLLPNTALLQRFPSAVTDGDSDALVPASRLLRWLGWRVRRIRAALPRRLPPSDQPGACWDAGAVRSARPRLVLPVTSAVVMLTLPPALAFGGRRALASSSALRYQPVPGALITRPTALHLAPSWCRRSVAARHGLMVSRLADLAADSAPAAARLQRGTD